jgi:hypothetical protein
MKQNSRQQKARYLQNIVKDKIMNLFNLSPQDIRTSNTGENGEDVKLLSITAKRVFPYATECKNTQGFKSLYSVFRKTEKRNKREPLLVIKMNREKPLAIITLEHFFELIQRND